MHLQTWLILSTKFKFSQSPSTTTQWHCRKNRLRWMSPRIIGSFENFLDLSLSRKNRLGWMLIWKTIVWTTWNLRNGVHFSEGTFFVECLIDSTFILEMVLDKNLGTSCSFYEWGTQPNFCWNPWSLVGCGVESLEIWLVGASCVCPSSTLILVSFFEGFRILCWEVRGV
jgi:hypothetical protein